MRLPAASLGSASVAIVLSGVSLVPWLLTLPGAEFAWGELWTPATRKLIASSGLLAVGTACVSLALGALLTIPLILAQPGWYIGLYGVVVGMGFFLAPVIHLAAWKAYSVDRLLSPGAASVMVLAGHYGPIVVAMTLWGLATLSRSAMESAFTTIQPLAVARFIIGPQLYRIWSLTGFLILVVAFSETETPSLLRYPVYGEEILARLAVDESPAKAIVLAWLPAGLAILISPLLWRCMKPSLDRGWGRDVRIWLGTQAPPTWRKRANSVIEALTFLLILPVLGLAAKTDFGELADGLGAVSQSACLATASALIATVIGQLIVDGLVHAGTTLRSMILATFGIQLLLPGSLLGLAMIELGQWPLFGEFSRGDGWLVVTHVLRILPWLVLLLAAFRREAGLDGDETSRFMPMTWLARQRFLVLPRIWPGLLCVFTVGLTLALSDLATTILVVAPGTETAILRLYNLIHYGDWNTVAGLALVLAATTLGMLLIAGAFFKKLYGKDRRAGV